MEAHGHDAHQNRQPARGTSVSEEQGTVRDVEGQLAACKSERGGCRVTTEALRRRAALGRILGRSRAITDVRRQIEMLSSYEIGVLIYGETGTGKELVARAIHYLSDRAGGPFVPVNCGAIPESLFENELFGHIGGAFTDARRSQVGLVREAEGGTLFLDEIGAISLYNQVKLLRFLQDNEYKRLGDARPHKANVRMVVATNKDLLTLVRKGVFREDLYYRLDVASIRIPPLRERTEDIPLLARHFLRKYSAVYDKVVEGISDAAMRELLHYAWPGNIRELENRLQNLILMASGSIIHAEDIRLPPACSVESFQPKGFADAKRRTVASFERNYLIQLLRRHQGDVVGAAKEAGKSRTGLWNLISKHGFSPKEFGDRGILDSGSDRSGQVAPARHRNVTHE